MEQDWGVSREACQADGAQCPIRKPVTIVGDVSNGRWSDEIVDNNIVDNHFEQLQSLPRRVVRVDVDRHTEGQVVRDVIDMLAVYGVPWTPSATLAVGVVLNML